MADQSLKKQYVVYILTALFFSLSLSAAAAIGRYHSEMRSTIEKLRTLSGSSAKVRMATRSTYESTLRIKKEIPLAYFSTPPETVLFQAVDTIREQVKDTEVVIESLQDRGTEVVLSIALKGPLADYGQFLKTIQFLESLRFPFFSASELTMTQEKDKAACYELRGSIRTIKTPNNLDVESPPRRRS
jgi:hypothetical protein